MVEAEFHYLAAMDEKPVFYLCEPPEGASWRNTRGDRRVLPVEDARGLAEPPQLDREGVALVGHVSAVDDFGDGRLVRERYYPELEKLVAEATGAVRVLAFDHNLRSGAEAGRAPGVQLPVRFVHNDYTEDSGPRRVRDLLGDEAEDLLQRRFAVINVWRPLRRPVRSAPLAILDARSLHPDHFIRTDLVYADRTGEIYACRYDEGHRWLYFPEMRPDEALLLKCYDSDPGRARFTAHSAFDDPTSPADAPPRESVELRTLAFFA